MDVLQLGPNNWAEKYNIPDDIVWHYNDFSAKKYKNKNKISEFAVVILTGANNLQDQDWKKLQWITAPYTILYLPGVKEQLSSAGQEFLTLQAGKEIDQDPQTLINEMLSIYFVGQSGIRYFPTDLLITNHHINEYEFIDSGHLKLLLDTHDKWETIGSYKPSFYMDANRVFKLWLALRTLNIKVRLRVYPAVAGTNGDVTDYQIINIDPTKKEESQLNLPSESYARFVNISIEAKGEGALILGVLHWRWSRKEQGAFIVGGQRIVDQINHDDIAYYFNPGDMKPPLNVYFSGARGLEGFEAYPLFRRLKAPSLLFTDMRLAVGEFYDDASQSIGEQIMGVINKTLEKLGFSYNQLLMTGISMGTYPALKYGAQMKAHAIVVAKPITNLGYVAERERLQRPDEFDTIFDIDNQFVNKLDLENLQELDQRFWERFEANDLIKTRLFIGYMKNDDYDNLTVQKLKQSKAIEKARQIVYKGYEGRHNDNPDINIWFIERLHQILETDFGRKTRNGTNY